MKTRYIRLLSYDNACNVIDFISSNDGADYGSITIGGVTMQVSDNNWEVVENYIKSLNVRYEISDKHPMETERNIVDHLKQKGII